jgi:intein-encoded DNA endonuclease-like protein
MPKGIYDYEKKIRIKPNLDISEDLVYLLGAIKGDGNISSDNKYLNSTQNKRYRKNYRHRLYQIRFYNTDFEFLRKIFHIMQNIKLNPNVHYNNNAMVVNSCSKIMWEWWQSLTIPKLELLLKQDKKYVIAFLRGFYEAEGCYYYESGVNYPYVVITNCNEELVSFVHSLLCKLGFYAKLYKIKRGKTAFKEGFYYHILIRKKGEAKKFIDMINPSLKNEPTNAPNGYNR